MQDYTASELWRPKFKVKKTIEAIRKFIVFCVETVAEIVTMFCRLQTLYFRELQVKRQWLGKRFVNARSNVCGLHWWEVYVPVPEGDKLSTER
jgi:hypothetical protein